MWLTERKGQGNSLVHGTESAVAGAGFAEDEKSGCPLGPAFPDIGTFCTLAYCMQIFLFNEMGDPEEILVGGKLHL